MTPQRTLRGKRHLRAARSVQIGRDAKRTRKFDRGLRTLGRFVKIILPQAINDAYEGMLLFAKRLASLPVVFEGTAMQMMEDGKILEAQKEILNQMKEQNNASFD